MPTIITGKAHSERRDIFFGRINAAAGEGADVLVIVPDQYAFAMDKELYDRLGVKLFNQITTGGISSYSEKLCRELGGLGGDNADEQTMIMAMYRAQSRLAADKSSGINYYRRSLLKPSFVMQTITLLSGMSHSGITPETLRAAAETAPGGVMRLADISIIFNAYNKELAAMGMTDVASIMARAAQLAKKHGSFKGRKVFFDGFTSFSKDELLLVSAAVGSAAETVFSVVCGELTDGLDPFSETRRTISRIETIARDANRTVNFVKAGGCSQSAPLAAINDRYFDHIPEETDSEGLVKVCTATDIYEECDYICAEIVRLARDEGFKLSETAVICGSLEESSRILASACERYGIPYFVDKPKSALNSIPAKYLMSVLDAAVTKKYSTYRLMRIIKSPLSMFQDSDTFDEYDVNEFEEYCRELDIDGDMWLEPFPVREDDPRRESCRDPETYRRMIITPFEEFRSACAEGASVGDMCNALYKLLDALDMSDKIYSKVRSAVGNDTEVEVSRSLKQVWLGMINSVRSVYEHMKDEKLSLREFAEMLKLMLSTLSLSSPPQKADCLLIGDAERTRLPSVRALFIMQANEGVFPRDVKRSELLSDSDIAALETLDADNSLLPKVCLDNVRTRTYTAVTTPSERLYVSYSESDRTGAAASPSQLPLVLKALFGSGISVKLSELPAEFFCTSYRTAYYKYLEHKRENTVSAANIYASLSGSGEYLDRIANAEHIAGMSAEGSIGESLARRLYFRGGMRLSATRVSDFYKCPFYYFCKNGLRLPIKYPTGLSSANIGQIAHAYLERIMSIENGEGRRVYDEGFIKLTDEDIERRTDTLVDDIVKELFGSFRRKSSTFSAGVERLKVSLRHIAGYFRDELGGCEDGFRPAAFEYALGGENSKGCHIGLPGLKNENVTLIGSADRVDIYNEKNTDRTWIRVVDYKTGQQSFEPGEIYHGLGLQMLIYLLALDPKGLSLDEDREVLHAGVMYSHIRNAGTKLSPADVEELENSDDSSALERKLTKLYAGVYKPDGMMLDKEIRRGMNISENGLYTIFTYNSRPDKVTKEIETKKGTTQAVDDYRTMRATERFVLGKLENMVHELKQGCVDADPVMLDQKAKRSSCTYCEFREVCRNASPKEMRRVVNKKEDRERFREEIARIAGDMSDDKDKD